VTEGYQRDFELAPFRQQMLAAVPEMADLERWEQQAPETWQWVVRSPHTHDFQVEMQQISPGLIVVLVDETYSWEPREMPDPDAVGVLTALVRGRVQVLKIKHGPFGWRTFEWILAELDGARHCYPEVPARLAVAVQDAEVLTDSRPPQPGQRPA